MAGQTRFPTFSMKRTSASASSKPWSERWTSSASRWQAWPVVTARDGMPAARSRRASLSVARSAERAASLHPSPVAPAAVASSTAVFPAPGLPMRLTARSPRDAKCSRLWRAVRSLPARIFSCSSTGTSSVSPQPQVVHISVHLHLDVGQHQRVAPLVEPRRLSALRAAERSAGRDPPAAAWAGPARRHPLERERRARADRPFTEGIVRGLEQLRVHSRELADPDREPVDGDGASLRGLLLDALHERLDERVLMHGRNHAPLLGPGPSTYPREDLPLWLREEPLPEPGVEDDAPGPLLDRRRHHRGARAQRVGPERGEDAVGRAGPDADDGLPLVGHEERVDPQDLARGPHLVPDRHRGLLEDDPDLRLGRHLVEDRREAAARGVLQRDDVVPARGERRADEPVERRHVGRQVTLQPKLVAP